MPEAGFKERRRMIPLCHLKLPQAAKPESPPKLRVSPQPWPPKPSVQLSAAILLPRSPIQLPKLCPCLPGIQQWDCLCQKHLPQDCSAFPGASSCQPDRPKSESERDTQDLQAKVKKMSNGCTLGRKPHRPGELYRGVAHPDCQTRPLPSLPSSASRGDLKKN